MILKRKLYSRYYEEDRIAKEIFNDPLEASSNYVKSREAHNKQYLDKFDEDLKNSLYKYRLSNRELSEDDIKEIVSKNPDENINMITGDENLARKNTDIYRDRYSDLNAKRNKRNLTSVGAIVGAAGGLPVGPLAATAGLAVGAGVGYGISVLNDDRARRRGRTVGEQTAVLDGHGDRYRGAQATESVLKELHRSGKLNEEKYNRIVNRGTNR